MSIDLDPSPGALAALEGLAPGSALVEALENIDPAGLEGADAVAYLRACARERNRATARFLTAVHEAGRAEDGTRTRRAIIDEFSGDEVAAALGWSRAMAGRWMELADDLHRRLPEVQAALSSGFLDDGKARVFSEWTRDLADDHAHDVCTRLLPEAPGMPIGALIGRIQELAGALDPEWTARREKAAEKRARVIGTRNPSGTANLSGCDLPMDDTAIAMARVESLAAAVRRGGVQMRIRRLRAHVYLRLLDGFAAGLTDDVLVALLVAELGAHPDDAPGGEGGTGPRGPRDGGPSDNGPTGDGPTGPSDSPIDGDERAAASDDEGGDGRGVGEDRAGSEDLRPSGEDTPADAAAPASPSPASSSGEPTSGERLSFGGGRVREGTLEIRVRLSTALGLDDLPAQIPGWGATLAATARELLERYRHAEWRMVLTDNQGRLQYVVLPRRRPDRRDLDGRHPRPCRPSGRQGQGRHAIVELQAPTTLLAGLDPDDHPAWAAFLRDLQHRLPELIGNPDRTATPADATRRRPAAEIDRWVRIRDRQCVAPTCRQPAHGVDLDHTVDHALGGPSLTWNLGAWCRHDHRAKHVGGWHVDQPAPGWFDVTTRAGAHYTVRPPRITEPLPAPRPADRPRPLPAHEASLDEFALDDTDDGTHWPAALRTPEPVVEPERSATPADEPPPF